tara:strand:+ start:28085 stop:31354 length:3270 start_codon:yes stop_codon:yes gene_type:complete
MTQYTNVYPYVSEQLPEFIRSNNALLNEFMQAYYEYLEKSNDSDSSTRLTVYKQLKNPNAIIQSQTEYRDIDSTLVKFLDYFKREILPIAVKPTGADDRFLIKNIRDLYLAKGTPNSFKLLFRMLYNENIDVIQPGESILDASVGNFMAFNTMAILVNEADSVLNDIDFVDASIQKNDSEIALSIFGSKVDTINTKSVVTLTTSAAVSINIDSEITLINNIDKTKFITGTVLRQMKAFLMVDSEIGGYSNGDEIRVIQNNREFKIPITDLSSGPVTSITVKNRGIGYAIGDAIIFNSTGHGSGGSCIITDVDNAGRITAIDNTNVRTGTLRGGFLANDFQNVTVPIFEGGFYSELPKVKALSKNGTGAEIVPFSTTIGKINNFSIYNKGYFDSDTVDVILPMNINVHGTSNLVEGQTVRIQKFEADSEGFLFDSDAFRISVKFSNRVFTAADSDIIKVKLPYKFDFVNYQWIDSEYEFSRTDSDDVQNTFRDILRKNLTPGKFKFQVLDSDNSEVVSDTLKIFLQDPALKGLDSFHFNQLSSYEDSDKFRSISFKLIKNTPFLGLSENVGRFKDTQYLGKIVSVNKDKNIIKITKTAIIDSDDVFPIDSDLSFIESQRYKVLRLVPVDKETNNIIIDEKYPYDNIIANHQRGHATLSFEGSGSTSKQFLDDKGFSNSLSGGVIRDNLFYDNFSYSIKSTLSIADWREYVKTTLHPAGFRLLAQLNVDTSANTIVNRTATVDNTGETHKMTFDRAMDHSVNNNVTSKILTASNMLYSSNPFNFYSNTLTAGSGITADNESLNDEEAAEVEYGNSWWDYEPIGYIDPRSTQTKDSDLSERMHTGTFYSNTYDIKLRDSDYTQDYYKYQSMHRYPDQLSYPVGQTKFEPGENTFMLYDSDKIGRLNFISWDYLYDSDGRYTNDSDKAHLFTGINYTKLRDTDSDQIKQNITKRDFEYHLDYQKDFILATKNEKLFTFSVGDTLFYDDEAFEQKWHKIHLNRIQNTGWEIQGWASAIQNADGKKYRQLYSALNMIPQYAKEKSPVSNSFWVQPNNIVWTNTYLDPLNTSQLNLLAKEDSDYRDASRYYKSRRS